MLGVQSLRLRPGLIPEKLKSIYSFERNCSDSAGGCLCWNAYIVCEKDFVDKQGALLLDIAAKAGVDLKFISPTENRPNVISILKAAVAAQEGQALP